MRAYGPSGGDAGPDAIPPQGAAGAGRGRAAAVGFALGLALGAGACDRSSGTPPQAVEDRHGIEEVRKNGSNADEKRKVREENIEKASVSLKLVKPRAEKVVPPKSLKVEGKTNFVAAIARREGDGTLSIVHVSTNSTLIESLLANAAKDVEKSEKSIKTKTYLAGRA